MRSPDPAVVANLGRRHPTVTLAARFARFRSGYSGGAMANGLWKDQQSRPGPWPQGRRRPLAILAAVVAGVIVDVALHHVHSNTVLGGIVVLIALGGFYSAARLNPARLEQQRYTRGPGWFIGLAISKLPLPLARMAWIALSTGILVLGVVAIVGG